MTIGLEAGALLVLMLVLMKVSLKHSHGRFDFLATYIWQNFEPTLVKFLG